MSKIRIVETCTYEYEPELGDDFYVDCTTIDEAMEADKKWIESKRGTLEDLDSDFTSHKVWSIVT